MPSKILNFSKNRLITAINIIDGMLFFTDNKNEPKKINIEKFKGNDSSAPVDHSSGTTSIYNRTFEERDITVIKEHPKFPINTSLSTVGGGGSDIVIDPDDNDNGDNIPNPDASMQVINQRIVAGATLQFCTFRGTVKYSTTVERTGFYYTFDPALAYKETLISGVSGTFKVDTSFITNAHGAIFQQTITNNASNTDLNLHYEANGIGSASAGDKVYVLAYAKEQNNPNEKYSNIIQEETLRDNNAAPTGIIEGLTVKSTYSVSGFFKTVSFVGSYDSDGGLEIQDKGFIVSKGYLNVPGTPPTVDEVLQQIIDYDAERPSLDNPMEFPNKYTETRLSNLGSQITGAYNEFTHSIISPDIKDGYTYYVYSFLRTSNADQDTVYSQNPDSFTKTASGDTVEKPLVIHKEPNRFASDVELVAEINRTGNDVPITEYGFLTSTTIDNLIDLKKAFSDGVAGDYSPLSAGYENDVLFKLPGVGSFDSSGIGEFRINTSDAFGNLGPETRVYYIAYAKNANGAVGYAGEIGSLNFGEGALLYVDTLPSSIDKPVITIKPSIYKRQSTPYSPPTTTEYDILVSYEFIISAMPNNEAPDDAGIVFTMPTGQSVTQSIYDSREGFMTVEDIDLNNPVTIPKESFTFTSQGDSNFLGNYKIENFLYRGLTQEDTDKWAGFVANEILQNRPFVLNFDNPFQTWSTAYAYVVHNGVKYESEITKGALKPSNLDLDFDFSIGGGPSAANVVDTRNSLNQTHTNLTSTSVTLQGRIGNVPGLLMQTNTPWQHVGFYYSFTAPNFAADTPTPEELDAWAALPTTTHVNKGTNLTSAGGTSLQNFFQQDTEDWLEYTHNITGQTPGTKLYFCAYGRPRVASGSYVHIPYLSSLSDRTIYDTPLETLVFKDNSTSPPIPPSVTIISADKGQVTNSGTSTTFSSKITKYGDQYDVTETGIYLKPKSYFPSSPTAAQIKTEMANATGRITYTFSGTFISGGVEKQARIITSGDYYVAAYSKTNTNGNIDTYISDNNVSLNTTGSVVQQNAATPSVKTKAASTGWPPVLKAQILGDLSAVQAKKFHILGKSGPYPLTGGSFPLYTSGATFKSAFDSWSGPAADKITLSSGDTTNIYNYASTLTQLKRGYTYYICAVITVNGTDIYASEVIKLYKEENISKFINVSPTRVNYSADGLPLNSQGNIVYDGQSQVLVTTEKGSQLGNWKIIGNPAFGPRGRVNFAKVKKADNNWYLEFYIQPTNSGGGNRTVEVTIQHAEDPSLKASVTIIQKAASNDFDFMDDFRYLPSGDF